MSDDQRWAVRHLDLGLVDYMAAQELQTAYHQECVNDPKRATILTMELHPVVTMGKHAQPQFVLVTENQLFLEGVQFVATDRGGEATAHEPGQLVVYPILPLQTLHLMPKAYIEALEEAVIRTLADFQLIGARDAVNPGVWLDQKKVCALGIRIKDRVSMHGLAFNISNTLKTFSYIVPCGIKGRGVTSVAETTKRNVTVAEVRSRLLTHLAQTLSIRIFT